MAKNQNNVSDLDTENTESAAETTQANTHSAPPEGERYKGVTTFAYIGPSLPGGRLKSNTVLSGTYAEITGYYKEAVTLCPSVAKLIVPVSQLAQSREKTQKSGNIMHKYYMDVVAAINTKGEEK